MTLVVGFCGPAGAGKSTAARFLAARYGAERVRFAGPLKAMMRAFGLDAREVDGDLKEEPCALLGGRTPRQAMQWLGTEWGRALIGPDVWIDAWARAADAHRAAGRMVAVDDVRFLNEASAIFGRGGIVLKISRPGAGSASGAHHASEGFAGPWTAEIVNDGDIAALHAAIDDHVRRAMEGEDGAG